jgi:hypothetical protein
MIVEHADVMGSVAARQSAFFHSIYLPYPATVRASRQVHVGGTLTLRKALDTGGSGLCVH